MSSGEKKSAEMPDPIARVLTPALMEIIPRPPIECGLGFTYDEVFAMLKRRTPAEALLGCKGQYYAWCLEIRLMRTLQTVKGHG